MGFYLFWSYFFWGKQEKKRPKQQTSLVALSARFSNKLMRMFASLNSSLWIERERVMKMVKQDYIYSGGDKRFPKVKKIRKVKFFSICNNNKKNWSSL